jgi:hypothetical protein
MAVSTPLSRVGGAAGGVIPRRTTQMFFFGVFFLVLSLFRSLDSKTDT